MWTVLLWYSCSNIFTHSMKPFTTTTAIQPFVCHIDHLSAILIIFCSSPWHSATAEQINKNCLSEHFFCFFNPLILFTLLHWRMCVLNLLSDNEKSQDCFEFSLRNMKCKNNSKTTYIAFDCCCSGKTCIFRVFASQFKMLVFGMAAILPLKKLSIM